MAGEGAVAGGHLEGRRGVLGWLTRGFLALWGLGAGLLGVSFLHPPTGERRPSERAIRCGSFSDLAVGKARFVRHGADPLFVVRVSETEALAVSAVCTHMRCILVHDDASGAFRCPCHAGSFDRNGNVLGGPPTRPLARYPAEVRADEIIVRL